MKPGRELDALVFEKVMGWVILLPGCDTLDETIPSYSTDIAAAWPLWRGLTERFFHCEISFTKALKCRAELYRSAKAVQFADPSFEATGETGMHAICLVALKAAGVEVEDGAG